MIAYKEKPNDEIFSLALELDEIKGIHLLIETYQTLVLTTNDYERTFSSYNNVHTDSQPNLKVQTVDDFINIHMNGPELAFIDFTVPIEVWREKRKRRFV